MNLILKYMMYIIILLQVFSRLKVLKSNLYRFKKKKGTILVTLLFSCLLYYKKSCTQIYTIK